MFADGHDQVECRLLFRRESDAAWRAVAMRPLGNDRWRGRVSGTKSRVGIAIRSRAGSADSPPGGLISAKRLEAGQDISIDLLIGAEIIEDAAGRADAAEAERLRAWARQLREPADPAVRGQLALDEALGEVVLSHPNRSLATRYDIEAVAVVDRVRARYSTWYEVFPRSVRRQSRVVMGPSATSRDWLPYVAEMGFDVLYLPPIHPIGRSFRKGRNNTVTASRATSAVPGRSAQTRAAIRRSIPTSAPSKTSTDWSSERERAGLEMALDIAFQCSPDHPWVREHPEWFRRRPDGTIQYAENPPKKYQDIYPLDFETPAWRELWNALRDVMLFWLEQGVRILRVDNPHTKAFPFWEWALTDLKAHYPDALFLSEAFTRPRVMHRLAKLGFSQSYTYFTWRNTKAELTEYFTELTANGRAGVLPAESLAEYSRHPPRGSPGWRPTRVRQSASYWPRRSVRTTVSMDRPSSWERISLSSRQRGVSRLGEVRAQAAEPRRRRRAFAS